jgi:hypothetical protein
MFPTDRIAFDVPSDRRIIVSIEVVVQPRLNIIVLPRESEVVRDRGDGDGCFTEGFVVR